MIELLSDSVYGSFEEVVRRNSDKVALISLGEKYKYSELKEMVLKFAASLHELGIKEGDRVILYLYNLSQTVIAWLALQRLYAIPVMVAPVYTPYDLKYLANDSGAETIICMDTNISYVTQVLSQTPLKRVIVTNMYDLLPWWKKFIGIGFDRVPRGKIPSMDMLWHFEDLVRKGTVSVLPPFQSQGGYEVATMLYTGGTTGRPKGIPLPAGRILQNVREWRRSEEGVIPVGENINILAAPMYHVIGLSEVGASLLFAGEPIVILPRVVLDGMFDHIQRYKGKSMFAVPGMYRMILEHDRVDYYDLSSLKYCASGGDVLPQEVADRWFKKFNIPLYQGYGCTEVAGLISVSYSEDGIPPVGSAGKIVPGIEYRVVEPDTVEPVLPGESGELLVTADYQVTGYWNKPEETAKCFVNMEGKLWYRTRDIVRVNKDNWLYFEDRSVDMIKHKGYRVAAAEIEMVLQEHPAVVSSSVVGVPDPKVGERIKAFVVLQEDIKGVSSHDLIRWCEDRLPSYKVPSYIEMRDMLPKSKVGKFLRRELRDEERRQRE